MNKQCAAAIAAAAALGASTLLVAAPASAELTTHCRGEGGAVTVPGDLFVPRNGSCSLDGTTVTGDIRIGRGADLIAQDVTVGGGVTGANNAYFEAFSTSVGGSVVLNGAHGAYLEGSEVGDRVLTQWGADVAGGFVYTFQSAVGDDLVSLGGELFVESTEVAGALRSDLSQYTDLYDSFVDGGVLVRDNELGGVVCASAVQGESRFVGNTDAVQLGADGPFADCEGGNYWGGDVAVRDTQGGVLLDHNIVDGDLILRDNDPVASFGPSNLVRGDVLGEYDEWDGSQARQQRSASAETREQALQRQVEQRHNSAVRRADRAGNAHLRG
jgi:hypothetical protein